MAVKINSGIKVSTNEQCIEWKIDYMVKEQSFVASFAFSISTAVMAVVGGPRNFYRKNIASLTHCVCLKIKREPNIWITLKLTLYLVRGMLKQCPGQNWRRGVCECCCKEKSIRIGKQHGKYGVVWHISMNGDMWCVHVHSDRFWCLHHAIRLITSLAIIWYIEQKTSS